MRGPGRKRGTWQCKHCPPTLPLPGSRGPPAPRSQPLGRPARPRGPGRGGAGTWGPRPGGGPRRSRFAVVGVGRVWGCRPLRPLRVPLPLRRLRAAGPAAAHSQGQVMWRNALGGLVGSLGPGAGGGRWRPRSPRPSELAVKLWGGRGAPGAPRLVPGRQGGLEEGVTASSTSSAFAPRGAEGKVRAWKPLGRRNQSDYVHS